MKRLVKLTICVLLVLFVVDPSSAQRPELVVQTGHLKGIVAVAVSPDGRLIASGSEDQTIKIWEAEMMRELRTFKGYEGDYDVGTQNRLFFTPDGQILIAGDPKGITLWSVPNGAMLARIKKNYRPALSADGRLLASEEAGMKIHLRRVPTGEIVRDLNLGWEDLMHALDLGFTSDGTMLALANEKGVRLFNVETGALARTIGAGTEQMRIAFSSDGQVLVGATLNTLTVWDAATGRELRKMTLPIVIAKDTKQQFENRLYSIAFSSDNRRLAVATLFGMQMWDATNGKLEREWGDERMTVDRFDAVAFSADGKTLVGGALPGSVYRWDVSSGRELSRSTTSTAKIEDVAFSPNGQLMATEGGTTNIWNLTAGVVTQTHKGAYNSLFFTPDNQSLIRGFVGVDRLDLATRQIESLTAKGPFHSWQTDRAIAVSSDGELIAGPGETGFDGTKFDASGVGKIDLLSVRTNTRFKRLDGHTGVQCLAFSPNNKLLASGGGDNNIKFWDVGAGKLVRTLSIYREFGFRGVTSVAFNPKGDLLASGGEAIQIWNVDSGSEVRRLDSGGDSTVFSPNGSLLAAAKDDIVIVWDVASGAHSLVLKGHTDKVDRVVFTPDGRTLASVSQDETIKLWRVANGQLLATIIVTGKNDWLVVTPDGLFDGAPAAWSQIQWRFSENLLDVAPVEWFFSDFYYPGLLTDIFVGKRPKAPSDISQKDRRQPQLKLALPEVQPDTRLTARKVTVKVDVAEAATDKDNKTGSGARDVRLFRNGSLVKVWHGDVLRGQSSITLEATMPIVAGENRLTAYAFNHDNIKSTDATLLINGAESLKRQGTAYIIAVGINSYSNPDYNLKYAVDDAQDFAAEVKRQQELLKRYAHVEVISLTDTEATKANITEKLTQVGPRVQPEDAVIVYFAGHGTAHGNQFYLIPHDLGYDGPREKLDDAGLEKILAHSISDRDLEKIFEGIDASQLLLVIDACNSGQALEAEEKRRGPMNSKGLAQLAYEKGMYVLTAAQSYQAAKEAERFGHGFLTYALVEEGLKQGAADREPKNGTIDIRKWLNYATEEVPRMQEASTLDALRGRGRYVIFVGDGRDLGIPKNDVGARDNIQRPRLFYRRELDSNPLVVAVLNAPARQ